MTDKPDGNLSPSSAREGQSRELQRAVNDLAELRQRHEEILELLLTQQDGDTTYPPEVLQQLEDLSGRTTRMLGILEHLDHLLAQANVFKPMLLAPAKFARWVGKLPSKVRRRATKKTKVAKRLSLRTGKHDCVLMVAVNGVGLGHLTRTLAVARRLRRLDDTLQIVLLTTSPAVHLAFGQGILAYYVPSLEALPQGDREDFNGLLNRQIAFLLNRYQPRAIVYDGVWPYRGLMKGISRADAATRYWMRRGRWKRSATEEQLAAEERFDLIIEPGELGMAAGRRSDKHMPVNPITYLDPSDLMERQEARLALGLDQDHKAVLVSLGAANLTINRDLATVLRVLGNRPKTTVVIAESVIGGGLGGEKLGARVVREYPISRYFNAFDAAVTAAGYNTVHELAGLGLPGVLIPNPERGTDDQPARARAAEDAGIGICLDSPNDQSMAEALNDVLEPTTNTRMRRACRELRVTNGGDQAARIMLGMDVSS